MAALTDILFHKLLQGTKSRIDFGHLRGPVIDFLGTICRAIK